MKTRYKIVVLYSFVAIHELKS